MMNKISIKFLKFCGSFVLVNFQMKIRPPKNQSKMATKLKKDTPHSFSKIPTDMMNKISIKFWKFCGSFVLVNFQMKICPPKNQSKMATKLKKDIPHSFSKIPTD